MKVLIRPSRARKVLIHVHTILKPSRAKHRTLRLEEVRVLFSLKEHTAAFARFRPITANSVCKQIHTYTNFQKKLRQKSHVCLTICLDRLPISSKFHISQVYLFSIVIIPYIHISLYFCK